MFLLDAERTWVDPAGGEPISLARSLNTPLVAADDKPAERVQAYVVARRLSTGEGEVLVHFHLLDSKRSLLYARAEGPVAIDAIDEAWGDASAFCESMGFLLADLELEGLDPGRRATLVGTLPPFLADVSGLEEAAVEGSGTGVPAAPLDPLEEFQRAKAARAEAGQATTADFLEDDLPSLSDEGPVVSPDEGPEFEVSQIEALEALSFDGPAADEGAKRGEETPLAFDDALTEIESVGEAELTPVEPTMEVYDQGIFTAGARMAPVGAVPTSAASSVPASPTAERTIDEVLRDPPGSEGDDLEPTDALREVLSDDGEDRSAARASSADELSVDAVLADLDFAPSPSSTGALTEEVSQFLDDNTDESRSVALDAPPAREAVRPPRAGTRGAAEAVGLVRPRTAPGRSPVDESTETLLRLLSML